MKKQLPCFENTPVSSPGCFLIAGVREVGGGQHGRDTTYSAPGLVPELTTSPRQSEATKGTVYRIR